MTSSVTIFHFCQTRLHVIFFTLLLTGAASSAQAESKTIQLAATTSASNSGLLTVIIPAFEADSGYKIELFSTGSGNALHRARLGKADITITHAPASEEKLINDGYGKTKKAFMRNKLIIVGPESDPANIRHSTTITSALKKIENKQSLFISRGDDSGTHKKEIQLWKLAELDPYGDWYLEIGAGMGNTLKRASQQEAYTLTDSSTWLALRKKLKLTSLYSKSIHLDNIYTAIVINPKKHKHTNYKGARTLMSWLLSDKGRALIQNYKVDGEQLFKTVP